MVHIKLSKILHKLVQTQQASEYTLYQGFSTFFICVPLELCAFPYAINFLNPHTPNTCKCVQWKNKIISINKMFKSETDIITCVKTNILYLINDGVWSLFHICIALKVCAPFQHHFKQTSIWQYGSCIHLAMPTKPPSILINSLHPNNVIQLTPYIENRLPHFILKLILLS